MDDDMFLPGFFSGLVITALVAWLIPNNVNKNTIAVAIKACEERGGLFTVESTWMDSIETTCADGTKLKIEFPHKIIEDPRAYRLTLSSLPVPAKDPAP